ncbi:hypothetical protein Q0F98_04950 [Paenibacillus amylolyticus]|nr:hypothetical protein Q0F98_04950 [Paenibacillus amylolyticus]
MLVGNSSILVESKDTLALIKKKSWGILLASLASPTGSTVIRV